jgi:hypothetical protein
LPLPLKSSLLLQWGAASVALLVPAKGGVFDFAFEFVATRSSWAPLNLALQSQW